MIRQRLGSGGVASVYRAFDQVSGRMVALKVLPPTADEKTLSRFRREANTSGVLRHPHIVRTLQVGISPGGDKAYIAMELVDGETLGELLARCGRLSPFESCALLEPIADALAHAHSAGIVHRDVKPSNILLRPCPADETGCVQVAALDMRISPMLSDFGIARSLDSPELTSIGRTVGTPSYMAPEQCAGRRDIDGRADIYALGAVLYRCLVGRPPFSGSTTQILHAHVYEPLTIDNDALQRLPLLVVEILQRSMAKRPAERYADATEMADALASVLGRSVARPTKNVAPASGASDTTATLTLSSATPVAAEDAQPSAPRTARAVLIPGAPSDAPRRKSPLRPAARSTPADEAPNDSLSLAQRLERLNWSAIAFLAVGSLVGALITAFLVSGNSGIFGRLDWGGVPGNGATGAVTATRDVTMTPTLALGILAPTPTPLGEPDGASTATPTPTAEPTQSPTPAVLSAPTVASTVAVPIAPPPTNTPTFTLVPTETATEMPTHTPTLTLSTPTWTPTGEATLVITDTPSITHTATITATGVVSETPSATPAEIPTETPAETPTPTHTRIPPTPTWTPESALLRRSRS